MELKFEETETQQLFLGYVFDFCRRSFETLDIDQTIHIVIKNDLIEDNQFIEYKIEGNTLYLNDNDIKKVVCASNTNVGYKLLIHRVSDALYELLNINEKIINPINWKHFELSMIDFMTIDGLEDVVTPQSLSMTFFEYDYFNESKLTYDLVDMKMKANIFIRTFNHSSDFPYPSWYYNFVDQKMYDNAFNIEDMTEIVNNVATLITENDFVYSNILTPKLPTLINPIGGTNFNHSYFQLDYNKYNAFTLNNMMYYLDKSLENIIGKSAYFTINNVVDFINDCDLIYDKNHIKYAIRKSSIYNKINNRTLSFHEFVITCAIVSFYKHPYIEGLDLNKYLSKDMLGFDKLSKLYAELPQHMSILILDYFFTFSDCLKDFIISEKVLLTNFNKKNEYKISNIIYDVLCFKFTPFNSRKHFNAVNDTLNIVEKLSSIVSNSAYFNDYISYDNLISNLVNNIDSWIEKHNHFIQQMEADVASLDYVDDHYYEQIIEKKRKDLEIDKQDNSDTEIIQSMTHFNDYISNLKNDFDKKLLFAFLAKVTLTV